MAKANYKGVTLTQAALLANAAAMPRHLYNYEAKFSYNAAKRYLVPLVKAYWQPGVIQYGSLPCLYCSSYGVCKCSYAAGLTVAIVFSKVKWVYTITLYWATNSYQVQYGLNTEVLGFCSFSNYNMAARFLMGAAQLHINGGYVIGTEVLSPVLSKAFGAPGVASKALRAKPGSTQAAQATYNRAKLNALFTGGT